MKKSLTIRLSDEERAYLESEALKHKVSLSEYIRLKLFGLARRIKIIMQKEE